MSARSCSRRQTLALGGALTIVFAGGRLRMANAEGQNLPEGDAYAPWSLWDDPGVRDTPLALVAAAVLAANPHDTQPWLFRISDDAIEVFADLSRNLGAMDAFVREMHATSTASSRGNVVLFCELGNRADLRGLRGGAEGIRTSDLRRCGHARD
jgi:hypothetical protein